MLYSVVQIYARKIWEAVLDINIVMRGQYVLTWEGGREGMILALQTTFGARRRARARQGRPICRGTCRSGEVGRC